jgi:hypothetical protein
MSDKRFMIIQNNQILASLYVSAGLIIMITASLVLSNNILAGTETVPYGEGDSDNVPSAAARLCNIGCSRVPSGCAYTFDIEAFATCWKPIYAIEVHGLSADWAEPISCPANWKAQMLPAGATYAASMIFYTKDCPITPGSAESGFGFISYVGSITIRWFPADEAGILMGKVSRLDLACPTETDATSWGSIKAIYR